MSCVTLTKLLGTAPGNRPGAWEGVEKHERKEAMSEPREVRAPRGTELTAKSWQTEAPLRMLMNNLDPEVAERPEDLSLIHI